MTFRAINDSVIVEIPEVNKKETKRESGLFVIENDQTNNQTTVTGVIVSVGEGKFDSKTGSFVPPPVKVGDKVVLSLSTGIALDKTHKMVRTDDIFAVVE